MGPQKGGKIASFSFMASSIIYILYSSSLDKYYTGFTQDSVKERILRHNQGSYGKHRFTSTSNDWTLYHIVICECVKQALKIEKHIKRMKSRKYIENIKKYPEIIDKLKTIYPCT